MGQQDGSVLHKPDMPFDVQNPWWKKRTDSRNMPNLYKSYQEYTSKPNIKYCLIKHTQLSERKQKLKELLH